MIRHKIGKKGNEVKPNGGLIVEENKKNPRGVSCDRITGFCHRVHVGFIFAFVDPVGKLDLP